VDKMLTQLRKLLGPDSHAEAAKRDLMPRISHLAIASAALFVFALAGCSTFACQPRTVTVTNKRDTARLETVPGAMRTTETGRIEEDVRQSQITRDYWVQDREGTWHPVSAEQFREAEVGRELEICK